MAQTVSKEMLLFKLSLACSSQNVENRTSDNEGSDIDDGIVFDIDPSLLVDCDKIFIGDMIGKGSHSLVYKGWLVPIIAPINYVLFYIMYAFGCISDHFDRDLIIQKIYF